MNFLHHFYPSLLKIPGFLVEFITPIIKVGKIVLDPLLEVDGFFPGPPLPLAPFVGCSV